MDRTLTSILGGLAGMLGWGVSDFFANEASEKVGHTKALFWSQLAGLALMITIAGLFVSDFTINFNLFLVMCGTALTYIAGYLLFYKAFEIGNVSVVSAVINSQTLFVILVSYFIFHQPLTKFQVPAVAMIVMGVTLVSVNFSELKSGGKALLAGVKECLLAALIFGGFMWPLNEYATERGDWILVSLITRILGLAILLLFSLTTKTSLKVTNYTRRLIWLLPVVGVLEAIAVLGVSFGVSLGDAIIVAPISSGLTIITVLLAVIFLRERVTKLQVIGIVMTVTGIIFTAF